MQERPHDPHPVHPRRRLGRARCSPFGRSCTPTQTTTPSPRPTRPAKGSEPLLPPVSRRERPRSARSGLHTQLRSVRGRARRRVQEEPARTSTRGAGECARNDHRAPDTTAAKQDEYIEQTGRGPLVGRKGRTIDPRRAIRISSSASSGRLKSSGASEYSRSVAPSNAPSSAFSSRMRTSPFRASD